MTVLIPVQLLLCLLLTPVNMELLYNTRVGGTFLFLFWHDILLVFSPPSFFFSLSFLLLILRILALNIYFLVLLCPSWKIQPNACSHRAGEVHNLK